MKLCGRGQLTGPWEFNLEQEKQQCKFVLISISEIAERERGFSQTICSAGKSGETEEYATITVALRTARISSSLLPLLLLQLRPLRNHIKNRLTSPLTTNTPSILSVLCSLPLFPSQSLAYLCRKPFRGRGQHIHF